ncbi:hypothetical protein [Sphingomonas sp. KC8]|uniref:hypothetical protein n=1 Tax=Sphingomonas sp. KC8 TaxID=1030157 RepID=UPI0011108DCD|nr:hypothetical protein [Sphingomonas sp. KC8]
MTKLEWGVVFSVLASAASLIFSAGVVWTTVQVHDRDISALKTKGDETTDRLARMETKIDMLLEQRISKSGGM